MPPSWWGRRRAPDPLGEGVWRRAHDRFRRAVDRYHAVLEHVPEGPLRVRLEGIGADLVAALDLVHAVCVRAQALGPSAGDEVPAGEGGVLLDVHRALTRSATLAAQAAEAVTLTVVAVRQGRAGPAADSRVDDRANDRANDRARDEAQARVAAAARTAGQARSQVSRAEALLASVHANGDG